VHRSILCDLTYLTQYIHCNVCSFELPSVFLLTRGQSNFGEAACQMWMMFLCFKIGKISPLSFLCRRGWGTPSDTMCFGSPGVSTPIRSVVFAQRSRVTDWHHTGDYIGRNKPHYARCAFDAALRTLNLKNKKKYIEKCVMWFCIWECFCAWQIHSFIHSFTWKYNGFILIA